MSAESAKETPRARVKREIRIKGAYNILRDKGTLKNAINMKNTKDSKILISRAVMQEEITKISLGK
ncbi:hypothetical protein MTHERMMSTA1_07890 [Methanosarcina thermophila MST-A1]|uniref:Uncharacterized protein n=1 Tax=Methanosarcina thermophila TaxID=2210 RepID=A0A3G9CW49_METTE|nr:hypothetical protein MESMT1_1347 [Methanosarcina thermophila]GLI13663.1 hypothetical protein MTHERMMSTA1_07890 [Methanosarcina thermophila MST-A1]